MRRDAPDVLCVPMSEVLPWPAAEVVEVLGSRVTPRRLAKLRAIARSRVKSVVAVLDGISDPHNGSAILRSADAFGVQEIHVVHGVVQGPHGFVASRHVAKGSHRWLTVADHTDTTSCFQALRSCGYTLVVTRMDGDLGVDDLRQIDRLALVLGNEHMGASEEALALADRTCEVPMRGFVESLNVSVAAGICLHAATHGRPGDLSPVEQEGLVARWLLESVRDGRQLIEAALGTRE